MPDNSREAELLTLLQTQEEKVRRLEQENTLLRQKIDLLLRRLFGASSEKLDAAQLELLLGLAQAEDAAGKADASSLAEEAAIASCKTASRPERRRKDKPRWPADLPVLEEVIEPAEVKAEPKAWRCIGEPFRQAQGPERSRRGSQRAARL